MWVDGGFDPPREETAGADEARPFKERAQKKFREAAECKDKDQAKALARESRDAAAKAKEIEDAVYDLKAVNPNKKPVVDTRTPEELLDLIEAKGREIAEALAVLRKGKKACRGRSVYRPLKIRLASPDYHGNNAT